ncbi:MAG: YceI family protein [Crocinitomicaceae bacterium]|nr:YceI family protein [Crocinitomicaceae bacterium]
MEYILVAVLIALAVLLWRTNGRDQYHLLAILQSALAIAVFWMIGDDLSSENGLLLTAILSGSLILHFIISRFWKSKGFYWPPIFVLISSAFFFLFKDEIFNYGTYDISLIKPEILILPLLGSIIEPIANTKEKILGDFFKIDYKNRRGISRGTFVFVIGMFFFIGHFLGSYLGVALVLLGFGASLLYNKRSGAIWNMFLGMIAFASFGHFAIMSQIESSDMLLGRVIEGLLFGSAMSLFINTLGRAKKNKLVGTAISWFLFVAVPIGLILLAKVNPNFGGADAFIGLLAGFGFTALLGINTRKNSSLLAVYFAAGLFFIPMLINAEEDQLSQIVINNSSDSAKAEDKKEVDIFETSGSDIDIIDDYKIDAKNSQLTFELGPSGGRTKGAFRSFSGQFILGEKNSIRVDFPVDQLTTFNSMRDESLMEDSYFNQPKYPNMTFNSSELVKEGEYYIVKGDFNMMGKTLKEIVEMKYLGKIGSNNAPVFIGRSSIDRRKYGMKSDPKEGNIVDFTFKVELVK